MNTLFDFDDRQRLGFMSYSDYYFQIDKKEIFKRLLYGIFPDQLPSVICSSAFAEYIDKKGISNGDENDYEYIRYSVIRNTNVLRVLGVPSPRSYINLCRHISENWDEICSHMENYSKNQSYKVSRIHIRKNNHGLRIFKMGYKHPDLDGYPEDLIKTGKRFKVEVDIAKFYPSIYSHCIPWALMTKSIAKERQFNKILWQNKLDFYSRTCKNKETNGILIGPDSSSILSEIILCTIDFELCKKGYKYFRNIDDYTGYFDTLGEAEGFIRVVRSELLKFELQLNDKKTKITEAPIPPDKNWIASFRRHDIKQTYTKAIAGKEDVYLKTSEVKSLWTLAIELFLQHEKDSAILNYAMKTISGYSLGYNALRYHSTQCLHMTILYPYLCPILEEFLFDKYDLPKSEIGKFANELCKLGSREDIVQALTFSLTWCVKYGIKLEQSLEIESVIELNDCVLLLIDLLYRRQIEDQRSLKAHEKEMKILKKDSFSRYWLYLYEGFKHTQMKGYWGEMKKAGVSFVNIDQRYQSRRENFSFLEVI